MQHIQLEAARIVISVFEGRNLNQVLSESLRQHPLFTAQERGALQDLCYGALRHYGKLAFIRDRLMEHPARDPLIQHLLLIALYQLEFTKAGQYVIVDQAVSAAKRLNPRSGGLINAVLRNFLRQREPLLAAADRDDASRYSYPQWWIDALKKQYGEKAQGILEAGNQHPPMTLRVNARYTTAIEYLALLKTQDIAARVVEPNALVLEIPVGIERLPRFAEGWVSVQDAGAQYAAHLLQVSPGMRVLDACAAPGGKAAHLLEMADIELLALDKEEQRLTRVRENLQRLRLKAQVICGDAATPNDWWDGKPFQRILADVPCSASGVVRRHPDIKWLRRPADIESFAKQQAQILEALWSLLDNGGRLLYSTCSVFARENQHVIERFLANHTEASHEQITLLAEVAPTGQLLPNEQHDGFFYALLHKHN
ncbi:MAG: 16S rRNA (cytosine(967)-C(5))-methyltransferase RsmB [Gallionella sp.]|nr:16S rRNA (cytosine(967)-C(5))-methyltransferase RsmB [Gallionella sp.]